MSLWEFLAVMDGFSLFNGGTKKGDASEMTEARMIELGIEGFEP